MTKKLILSSAGLKNVVTEISQDEEFRFIFAHQVISIKNIFADFISPKVSKIRRTDPTIKSMNFPLKYYDKFNETTLSKIKLLSIGESVDIDEEESLQMKIISIFLENDELLTILNDLYPEEITMKNIDLYLTNLPKFSQISPNFQYFNYSNIIDYISSHFYLIDHKKLKELPLEIIHSIIFNSNLRLESEESLFDFINELFEDDHDSTELVSFYETIEFSNLSECKFDEFYDSFDFNNMSCNLWNKLCSCFYTRKKTSNDIDKNIIRYITKRKVIEFDQNKPNSNCGIINFLTNKSGGNVCENKTVIVTSSSLDNEVFDVKYAVDVQCKYDSYFCSCDIGDSWLKYDFVKRKVFPTHYTIKSRPEFDFDHPMNWVIEGSNTDIDSDWAILDLRKNIQSLVGLNKICSFEIKSNKKDYRFLRIRQIGPNSSGSNFLVFSTLEYYGILTK